MKRRDVMCVMRSGIGAAVVAGVLFGWLRYWIGCFVLVQGSLAGLGIAWVMRRGGRRMSGDVSHPGFGSCMAVAGVVFAAFMGAQAVGFGMAQPWFEPLGWLERLLDGRTVEAVFGVASTAGVHRGFALGLSGGWWVLFNLIDWAIMFFFLLSMSWPGSGGGRDGSKTEGVP